MTETATRAMAQAERRRYSPAERRADHVIHVLGLVSAAVAVPLMLFYVLRWYGASTVTAAAAVYAASLLATLGFSAAYHMTERPDLADWLRRGDHAAIYAKIAGAYTPVVMLHGGPLTAPTLAFLWACAAAGMALKIGWPRRWDRAAVVIYLAMGWSAVVIGGPLLEGLTELGLRLIVAGGLLYTIGVVFFLWESLPFQNAIWHALVLTATALVFSAILGELAAAAGDQAAVIGATAVKLP